MSGVRGRICLLALTLLMLSTLGCAGGRWWEWNGGSAEDAHLESRVQSALLDDPEVNGLTVIVDANAGEVQLSGFVNSDGEKQRAGAIAQSVEGVRAVRNRLQVK
ncbi:MAG: BON domain-containing protein [Gammaproteobacteria bacterium]